MSDGVVKYVGPMWIIWTPEGLLTVKDVLIDGERTRVQSKVATPGQIIVDGDEDTPFLDVGVHNSPLSWSSSKHLRAAPTRHPGVTQRD